MTPATWFRPPPRRGHQVTPLVDGKQAYRAMEEAIVAAQASVHMSWWEFDPLTPISSASVRRAGIATWGDLIVAKASGEAATGRAIPPAQIRLMLADFDPVFAATMHRKAWSAYQTLASFRASLSPAAKARLELIVAPHPALVPELDSLLGLFLRGLARQRLERLRDEFNREIAAGDPLVIEEVRAGFRDQPGLWPSLVFDEQRSLFEISPTPDLSFRPASHHPKLCLVDGWTGFCGGLDITPERIDDRRHRRQLPWHDVHCSVEGDAVRDMETFFFLRWNQDLTAFQGFVRRVNQAQARLRLPDPRGRPMETPAIAATPARARPGKSHVQVLFTLSGQPPAGTITPTNLRRDVLQAYLRAISQAEDYIYLEHQYIRWPPLADAIIARHQVQPIKLIVVIPTLPEEVRGEEDPLTEHGIFLQQQLLERLATALRGDFGLFALAQPQPVLAPDDLDIFGSPQIYVHSKLMLVDDQFAVLGSANANGRSLLVDTELNISWADPSAIRKLRLQLWAEHLGQPQGLVRWTPAEFLPRWTSIAQRNAVSPPSARSGFAVPIDLARSRPGTEWPLGDTIDVDQLVMLENGPPGAVTHGRPERRPDDALA